VGSAGNYYTAATRASPQLLRAAPGAGCSVQDERLPESYSTSARRHRVDHRVDDRQQCKAKGFDAVETTSTRATRLDRLPLTQAIEEHYMHLALHALDRLGWFIKNPTTPVTPIADMSRCRRRAHRAVQRVQLVLASLGLRGPKPSSTRVQPLDGQLLPRQRGRFNGALFRSTSPARSPCR